MQAGCRMQRAADVHTRRASAPVVESIIRLLRWGLCLHVAFWTLPSPAAAQQLLDRIAARVSGTPIALTDLQAARGLGVVNAPTEDAALRQMIDRQLLLIEVGSFPPPEPTDAAIAAQVARERAAAGPRLSELMAATGTDEARLRDLARDTLRIEGYASQRFATRNR